MSLSGPYKRKELPMTNCMQASFNFPGVKDMQLKKIAKEEISHQMVARTVITPTGKRAWSGLAGIPITTIS